MHRNLVNRAKFYKGAATVNKVFKDILTGGTDVLINPKIIFDDWLKRNKEFQHLANNLHASREGLTSSDLNAWAVQKNSVWKEAINRHILLLDQVKCSTILL